MEVNVQDFTSLVEVLCALNITFYVWDGLVQRIIDEKRRTRAKDMAREDMRLGHEGQNDRVIAYAARVIIQLDDPDSGFRKGIGEAVSLGQKYGLAAALVLIAILVTTGLWPNWPGYELPGFQLGAFIATFILLAAAPILGTVNGIERLWLRWTRHYRATQSINSGDS